MTLCMGSGGVARRSMGREALAWSDIDRRRPSEWYSGSGRPGEGQGGFLYSGGSGMGGLRPPSARSEDAGSDAAVLPGVRRFRWRGLSPCRLLVRMGDGAARLLAEWEITPSAGVKVVGVAQMEGCCICK